MPRSTFNLIGLILYVAFIGFCIYSVYTNQVDLLQWLR